MIPLLPPAQSFEPAGWMIRGMPRVAPRSVYVHVEPFQRNVWFWTSECTPLPR